jgi:hypothetical protein
MNCAPLAKTGTVLTPSPTNRSSAVGSFKISSAMKSMPFFERNSFVLRQLLQPGWVKRTNRSVTLVMVFLSVNESDGRLSRYRYQWSVQLSTLVRPWQL